MNENVVRRKQVAVISFIFSCQLGLKHYGYVEQLENVANCWGSNLIVRKFELPFCYIKLITEILENSKPAVFYRLVSELTKIYF